MILAHFHGMIQCVTLSFLEWPFSFIKSYVKSVSKFGISSSFQIFSKKMSWFSGSFEEKVLFISIFRCLDRINSCIVEEGTSFFILIIFIISFFISKIWLSWKFWSLSWGELFSLILKRDIWALLLKCQDVWQLGKMSVCFSN